MMAGFTQDRRRLAPKFSSHGSLSASELDQLTAYPDIRIEREGSSVGVSWRFVADLDPASLPEDYTWAVERSGSPGGPFDRIIEGLPAASRFFRDDNAPRGRENTQRLFYRLLLEAVYLVDGEEVVERIVYGFDPEWNRVTPDREAYGLTWGGDGTRTEFAPPMVREIRQRVQMLMNHAGGATSYLYREAWTNPPCGMCVDPLTGTHTTGASDYCRSCLGTGFRDGYYQPMETVFIPVSQMNAISNIPFGSSDLKGGQRVIAPYWPPIYPRDKLRSIDGTLWGIGNTHQPDMYGSAGLQIIDISQLERDDPLNKIPLPDGFRTKSRGPRRQYARSMNLTSYAKSLAEGSMSRSSFFPLEDYQEGDE